MKRITRTEDEKKELIVSIQKEMSKGTSMTKAVKNAGIYDSQYYEWSRMFGLNKKSGLRKTIKKKTQLLELPMPMTASASSENIAMIICRTTDIRSVLENAFGGRT